MKYSILVVCMFFSFASMGYCGDEHKEGSAESYSNTNLDILDIKKMRIKDVLRLLSNKSGQNMIATPAIDGEVSIYLKDVSVAKALKMIADANNWAYVIDQESAIVMTQEEFKERFGYTFGSELVTKVFEMKHADAQEVADALSLMSTPMGKVIPMQGSKKVVLMDTPQVVQAMEALLPDLDKSVEHLVDQTEVFELIYVPVDQISDEVADLLSPDSGKMQINQRSNVLMVSDTPQKLKDIRRLVEAFDQKDREVLVEAKIIQITLSDEFKLGVDWQGVVEKFHNLTIANDFDIIESVDKSARLSIGTLSDDEYTATIEALETIGHVKTLSSPSIAALNHQEAKILIGATEPYVTTTTTTPSSGPTTVSETVEFIDVGVKLYVTPTIHKDDFITLDIKPEISSVTRSLLTSSNNTIPIVETTKAETSVTVKNGFTILIGGLIKEENISTRRQLPFVGRIPILGRALGNEVTEEIQNEIAIFLTPTIISGDTKERAFFNNSTFFTEEF